MKWCIFCRDGRGNEVAGKAENLTEIDPSRVDLAPLSSKDKDTTYSPPLGSRKVTFLDSPSSPEPPSTSRPVHRRSLSPEARVQERLSPGESKTKQNPPTLVRGPPQPWHSRRSRTLDPSQRLQDLGSGKKDSEWETSDLALPLLWNSEYLLRESCRSAAARQTLRFLLEVTVLKAPSHTLQLAAGVFNESINCWSTIRTSYLVHTSS